MRFKLDENLGVSAAALLTKAGLDVSTVIEQRMAGWSDADLFRKCATERRVLVTFDLDVANPFRFDPSTSAGIVVLRPSGAHTLTATLGLLQRLIAQLASNDPDGRLWIVEPDRVRDFQPGGGPND